MTDTYRDKLYKDAIIAESRTETLEVEISQLKTKVKLLEAKIAELVRAHTSST